MIPRLSPFSLDAYHRLIPSRYSESDTVLQDIAESEKMLADLILLDGATNERILGEQQGLVGISTYELVYGIPHAHIVNAAFTHTSDAGGRFNDHTRGAWYAAQELETSLAEVTYHKSRRLAEMVVPELPQQRPDIEISTYDDWLADFRSLFHVLEPPQEFSDYLQPEPVPECYRPSQAFARLLIEHHQSNGIIYPSVRREGYRCLVCFRPALVCYPRRAERLEITFTSTADGYQTQVHRLLAQTS